MWSAPTAKDPRRTVSWAGVRISSNVPLPRLPSCDAPADLEFTWESGTRPVFPDHDVQVARPPGGRTTRFAAYGDESFAGYEIERVGMWTLEPPASRIRFYPDGGCDPMRAEHFLVNTILALYAGFSGTICLHASAVAKEDRAVVFTGPSGSGKSTAAWERYSAGWSFITDDIAVIRPADGAWSVWPGPRSIRLKQLGLSDSWTNAFKQEAFVPTVTAPQRIAEIRILQPKDGRTPASEVSPIGSAEMFRSLCELQPAWGKRWAAARPLLAAATWDLLAGVPIRAERSGGSATDSY